MGAQPPWTKEIMDYGVFRPQRVLNPPMERKQAPPPGKIPEYTPESYPLLVTLYINCKCNHTIKGLIELEVKLLVPLETLLSSSWLN